MSDSVRPHRRQPTRLPRPWDSPGRNTGVGCHFLLQCVKVKSESEVTQSCPTLSDPMDFSPLGSSVHGIFQARVLEWGAIAFSEGFLDWRLYRLNELSEMKNPSHFLLLFCGTSSTVTIPINTAPFSVLQTKELGKGWLAPRGHLSLLTGDN